MPTRQAVITVPTPSAQGEDSWVKVRRITVAEKREGVQAVDALIEEALQLEGKTGSDETFATLREQRESLRLSGEADRLLLGRFATHIHEWNWVDEDGEPLPQVRDDSTVLDTLLSNEIAALKEAMGLADATGKN